MEIDQALREAIDAAVAHLWEGAPMPSQDQLDELRRLLYPHPIADLGELVRPVQEPGAPCPSRTPTTS